MHEALNVRLGSLPDDTVVYVSVTTALGGTQRDKMRDTNTLLNSLDTSIRRAT